LGGPSAVTWDANEPCGQESLDQFPGAGRSDDAATQAQNVDVVILSVLMGREMITSPIHGRNGCVPPPTLVSEPGKTSEHPDA
jgi:hypothetical protein